jgi:hypothetical protein
MTSPDVVGLTLTTSKGFGREPHFSFSKLTDTGLEAIQQQMSQHDDANYWQELANRNLMVGLPLLEEAEFQNGRVNLKQDAMTALRGADGFDGVMEYLRKDSADRRSVIEYLASRYDWLLSRVGFQDLNENQTPSLIARKTPKGVSAFHLNEVIMKRMAEAGVGFGGVLSELGWSSARGSIPNELVDDFFEEDAEGQFVLKPESVVKQLILDFERDLFGDETLGVDGKQEEKDRDIYIREIEDATDANLEGFLQLQIAGKAIDELKAKEKEIKQQLAQQWQQFLAEARTDEGSIDKPLILLLKQAIIEAKVLRHMAQYTTEEGKK